jgi:hypothetical protein
VSTIVVVLWVHIHAASIILMSSIQNDQQFIQTMINQGRRKRKLDDENDHRHMGKVRRTTIKNEPEQVIVSCVYRFQRRT